MEKVLVFNTEILPRTQTFTASVINSMRRFEPVLIGLGPARNPMPFKVKQHLLTTDHTFRSRLVRNLYKEIGIAPQFHREVRTLAPKLLRIEFLEGAALAWGLLRAIEVPAVVTLHGSIECSPVEELKKMRSGRLYIARRESIISRIAEFHCVSDFIRRQMIAAGFPGEKLRTHYIGIDRKEFSPATERPTRPVVLFVGRLVEKKGLHILIRAMKIVQNRLPRVHLEVIGDGPLRPVLERDAVRMSVNISFRGFENSTVIRERIAKSSVLCVPSVRASNGDSEGLGMVALEAQAMGRPVVASDHGGLPEAIAPGVTGALVREGDIEGLADALSVYLEHGHDWQRASEAAIEWVADRFDLLKQTAKLERRLGELSVGC